MESEAAILTGIQGAKVVDALSRDMTRSDWISFAKEFKTASADKLVIWHLRHKRKKLLDQWPLSRQSLSIFELSVREISGRHGNIQNS